MKNVRLYPLPKPIYKEINLPGCLGYTIRALNIAAMTKGGVKIKNPLKSDDIYTMVNALKILGIDTKEGENYFFVHGDISDVIEKEYIIDIGLSGRTARSILALLSIVPGVKTITCKESFKRRPIGDLVDGLRQLGADITYLEKNGYLPVKIASNRLNVGNIKMHGNLSSQYFSAIMMIAPLVGEINIEVINKQSSKPFIDMTIEIMKNFGVSVINKKYKKYIIKADQIYKNPGEYFVESDAIAASYFWSIAAITQSEIKILNLSPNSKQGDIKFADLLGKMGCKIIKNEKENWISVAGTRILRCIRVNMNDMPDSVMSLAVVAAFANGKTVIDNIEHLKIKETDRLQATKNELSEMGVMVKKTKDSLTIFGGNPKAASIDTYGDHRMAMAFAVAGAKIPNMGIKDTDVVSKSFPDFWEKLKDLGVKIKQI